jgi:hypothetical protein
MGKSYQYSHSRHEVKLNLTAVVFIFHYFKLYYVYDFKLFINSRRGNGYLMTRLLRASARLRMRQPRATRAALKDQPLTLYKNTKTNLYALTRIDTLVKQSTLFIGGGAGTRRRFAVRQLALCVPHSHGAKPSTAPRLDKTAAAANSILTRLSDPERRASRSTPLSFGLWPPRV